MKQKLTIFQQNNAALSKINGIQTFGNGRFEMEIISIDTPLPELIEDATEFLPAWIEADLVLDFLNHPDLSYDLGTLCLKQDIPLIASGRKSDRFAQTTPPT